jgi:AcrR family transcriptional regulator
MSRRPNVDGRALIVSAALRLFADHGVDAVSIRAVNREAGVGPGTVHYHFQNKDNLVDEILHMFGDQVVTGIIERGRALAADTQPHDAHDFIAMIAEPYLDLVETHGRDAVDWIRIINQFFDSDIRRVTDERAGALTIRVARRIFPDATDDAVQRAMAMSIQLFVGQLAQSSAGLLSEDPATRGTTRQRIDFLIDFLAGGVSRAVEPLPLESF